MWFVQPQQDYIPEMPWKHTDEPAIMSWQIRARNYDTRAANILFLVLMVVYFFGAYFFLLYLESRYFLLFW
ncbi:hypothetical protein [Vreelandella hamiltonii]|uniref:Uncharacterized protein n=1 Tax=Halomonas johnsoniae TaxID=502832 RepID=A0ABQ2WN98_9GAMM|nr:hypothetical protein [Halomonas johnsoniae]GGW65178.1 hypothetical protein GCM10007158_27500 [Halomonas johnsoniae]